MNKVAIFLALASLSVQGKQCEAYNNLKHTKNTHNVVLGEKGSYRVVRKHKGQYLVVIKGEQPAQRWVDSECIGSDSAKSSKRIATRKITNTKKYDTRRNSSTRRSKQNLLVLSWHNSFCQTHRSKKECKSESYKGDGNLVLHGLWPQPRSNAYCNVPKKLISKDKHHQWKGLPDLEISKATREMMSQYMPGAISGLHKHEWIKHGTCYGKAPDLYYKQALTFAKRVDESKVGKLFKSNIGKTVSLKAIRRSFEEDFGRGSGESIVMKCKNGLITELWITLTGDGDNIEALTKNATKSRIACARGLVDPKGY